MGGLLARAVAITVFLEIVVAYLNSGRGVPLMFGVFLGLTVLMGYTGQISLGHWGLAGVGAFAFAGFYTFQRQSAA